LADADIEEDEVGFMAQAMVAKANQGREQSVKRASGRRGNNVMRRKGSE